MKKLVRAVTAASLGTVATQEDVDIALGFVRVKLGTALRLREEIPQVEEKKSKVQLRHEFIQRTFGGEVVTADEVHAALVEGGQSVSIRTVERDFESIADKTGHGQYLIKVLDQARLINP